MAAPVNLDNGFSSGTPEKLFQLERFDVRARSDEHAFYDVLPDGSRFLVTRELESSYRPAPVHVVVNWDQELQRLAETR